MSNQPAAKRMRPNGSNSGIMPNPNPPGPPMMPGPPLAVPPNASCIIVAQNLPLNCTEKDLYNIFTKYGNIRGVHVNAGIGFVDFMDINVAIQMVTNGQSMPFYVGQNVAKLDFAQPTIAMFVQNMHSGASLNSGLINTEELSSVLQFDIANAQYQITVDVLKTICSSSGNVIRIIIGKKKSDNSVEALIEYASQGEAKAAKEALHGADIYSGCCTLTISFSKLQRLHVLKNDSESCDYTSSNPGATPVKEGLLGSQPNVTGQPSLFQQQQQMQQQMMGNPGGMGFPNSMPGGMMHPPPNMGPPMGPGNDYMAKYPPPGQGPLPYYMKPGQSPSGPMPMPGPMPGGPPMPPPNNQGPNGPGTVANQQLPISMPSIDPANFVPFQVGDGVVIMTYNMAPCTNCDNLFNLFCLYGNVARIKFLKSRQGCAMIQMGSKDAAELVLRFFDGVRLFNSIIQVCRSKQMEVQDQANPQELADGSQIQINYMQNPNNRFRNAEVASKCKIVPPGQTLHFFNIPPTYTRDQLIDLFVSRGARSPDKCVIFPVKHQQKAAIGLIEWETVEDAIDALARTNHTAIELDTYNHPFHLKLAFSNKPITEGYNRPTTMMMMMPKPDGDKASSVPTKLDNAEAPTQDEK